MLNSQTISQNMPNNRGNTLFQQHYNNQNSNGLPGSNGCAQNLRKISLVKWFIVRFKTNTNIEW